MATRDRIVLEKIISFCERINNNLERNQDSFDAFKKDYMFQDACCMCIVQIGELVSLLSEETKQKSPHIPWCAIKDTRNFYVHNYGAIDLDVVWATMHEDIPTLIEQCGMLLKDI